MDGCYEWGKSVDIQNLFVAVGQGQDKGTRADRWVQ